MGFEQDWILRQIEMIVRLIAKAVFNKETASYDYTDEARQAPSDQLHDQIMALVARRELCRAEDLLFDALDTADMKCLEAALDFYHALNALDDVTLENANFPRAEIDTGLKAVLKMYGLETLMQ